MAIVKQIDHEAFQEWVKERPQIIQKLCKSHPPDRLYRLNETGSRVTIYSYSEDGTLTVEVTGEYNAIMFARRVFGINPNDLVECDLPDSSEQLGEILTDGNSIERFLIAVRKEMK